MMDTRNIELLITKLRDLAGSKIKHVEPPSEEVQVIVAAADALAHVLHNYHAAEAAEAEEHNRRQEG